MALLHLVHVVDVAQLFSDPACVFQCLNLCPCYSFSCLHCTCVHILLFLPTGDRPDYIDEENTIVAGDRVVMELDIEFLTELQREHGGFNDAMAGVSLYV